MDLILKTLDKRMDRLFFSGQGNELEQNANQIFLMMASGSLDN